eukprot:gene11951-2181_t
MGLLSPSDLFIGVCLLVNAGAVLDVKLDKWAPTGDPLELGPLVATAPNLISERSFSLGFAALCPRAAMSELVQPSFSPLLASLVEPGPLICSLRTPTCPAACALSRQPGPHVHYPLQSPLVTERQTLQAKLYRLLSTLRFLRILIAIWNVATVILMVLFFG